MIRILPIAVLAMGLAACGDGGDEQAAAPAADTGFKLPATAVAVAEVKSVKPSFEFPAIVEAVQLARVRPEVSAVLKTIHFEPGDQVEQGQLLLEFDASEYDAAFKAATAEQEAAQASLQQATANWARAEDLMPKGFISQQDYDKAKAAIDSARAAVAKARAGLARAQLDLDHTRIFAPFPGKISKANYSTGDYVVANSPNSPLPLFTLVQMDPVYVTSSVGLKNYHRFVLRRKELQAQGIEIPELKMSLKLAGNQMYDQRGRFQGWDNVSSAGSGTITGRVEFANPDGLLLPGNNVTLMGETLQTFERVVIPQKAVMQDQQGAFVRVIGEKGTVERRNIELGIRTGDGWVVMNGLEEGATVITAGAEMLREGTPVTVQ